VCGGSDVVVRSRTGSGKTLGFAIPVAEILERHSSKSREGGGSPSLVFRAPRALVLAPTRELARQIEVEFKRVGGMRTVAIYGGAPIENQIRALHDGVDVVVGTPGRVHDLAQRGDLSLGSIKICVLDEADEMLNLGFKEAVEDILTLTPKDSRQSMLWSATVPPWVRQLSGRFLRSPHFIDLIGEDTNKLPPTILPVAHLVDGERGRESALDVLLEKLVAGGGRGLVFTDTRREVLDLCGRYNGVAAKRGRVRVGTLHGDMSQAERERTLYSFRRKELDVLVATDVAARGLDITDITHVIQYRTPQTTESFLHRSGRTGRAGKSGESIVLITPRELHSLRDLERELGFHFSHAALPPVVPPGLTLSPDGVLKVEAAEETQLTSAILALAPKGGSSINNKFPTAGLASEVSDKVGAAAALEAALFLLLTAGGVPRGVLEGAKRAVQGVQYTSILTGAIGSATVKFLLPMGSKDKPTLSVGGGRQALAAAESLLKSRLGETFRLPTAYFFTKDGGVVMDISANCLLPLLGGVGGGGAEVELLGQLPPEVASTAFSGGRGDSTHSYPGTRGGQRQAYGGQRNRRY